jgi:hypothetical protein
VVPWAWRSRPGGAARDYPEVLELVGKGGRGLVPKAFDIRLQRACAIKVMAPSLARDPTARKRFVREARVSLAPETRGTRRGPGRPARALAALAIWRPWQQPPLPNQQAEGSADGPHEKEPARPVANLGGRHIVLAGNGFPGWLAASADGKVAVPVGSEALLYDLHTGKRLRKLTGLIGRAYVAAFSPDGQTILEVTTHVPDRSLRAYDAATGRMRPRGPG